MSNGLFEVLAADDDHSRTVETRAVIAAQTRAKARFGAFVEKAATLTEREARIELVSAELDAVLGDVAEEYGYDNTELLRNAATVALGGGHPSGCSCGFCANKGNLPGSKKDDDGDSDDKSDDKDDKKDDDKDDDDDDDKGDKKPWESSVKTAATKESCDCAAHDGGKCTCGDDCKCSTCKKSKVQSAVQIRQTAASAAPYDWDRVASVKVADGFSKCDCDCGGCDEGNHCESEKCIETKSSGNGGNPESAGSSEKTAAGVETGDSYATETVDLPKSDGTGLGGPSPKIDKGPSGTNLGWDLEPIDVPSNRHPNDKQQIHQTPEYKADLPGASDTGVTIDASTPLQPEHNVAPNTETWTGTDEQLGQQNPVTSAKLAQWTVLT
jgi:hypothetical protein